MNIKQPTILTNLQRGNVKQEDPVLLYQRTIYELAAQGEIYNIEAHLIDAQDENHMTPLLWAAGYGQNLTCEYLLRSGANPNHRSHDGKTALILASSKGYLHVVKTLIRNGANIDDKDSTLSTALMYAVYDDHSMVVQELIRNGANIGMVNVYSQTAYALALSRHSKSSQAVIETHLLYTIGGGQSNNGCASR